MSEEPNPIVAIADKAAADLMEHCQSVRIFVTFEKDSHETGSYETGLGNFYAQLGQVVEWMAIQDQYQRNYADRKDDNKTGPHPE
jgi:hypothetical protein